MSSSPSTTPKTPTLSDNPRHDFHLALAFKNVELTDEEYSQTMYLPWEKWSKKLQEDFPWAKDITPQAPPYPIPEDPNAPQPPKEQPQKLKAQRQPIWTVTRLP
jgi:hypothetical protein